MTRYPWMVFKNTSSTGLEKIPLNGNVQIIDAGGGKPKYITVIDISGLSGMSIADLLTASTQWIEIGAEKGGIEFNSGTTYAIGDIVSNAGTSYRCKTAGTGTWVATEWDALEITERGGLLYNPGLTYEIGDLVTYTAGAAGTEETYKCKTQITIPESWVANKWTSQAEKGGIIFDTVTDYKVGDIVTEDNSLTPLVPAKVYRCITDTTAGAMVPAEWSLLSEQGGVEYDATVYYNKGDMVTDSVAAPAKTYYSISASANMGNDPKSFPAFWQELNSIFYNAQTGGDRNGDGTLDLNDGAVLGDGGNQHCPWKIGTGTPLTASWNSGTAYVPGDEVNQSEWKYSCLSNSTGDDPSSSPTKWRLISADGNPDAGNAAPNTLGEYPGTGIVPEKIGASWLISGLGFDDNGEKYKYTMTGGSLNGIDVKDGDQIIWMDGATGSEIWFFSPAPEVTGERGGLLWVSGKNYIIGDVVGGSDGKQYTAIWQSAGMDPTDQATNNWAWSVTTEGGGLIWDEYKTYQRGAIVSLLETYPSGIQLVEQYLCKVDDTKTTAPSVGDGTAPPLSDGAAKAAWAKYEVVKYFSDDISFTVGPGEDFPSLNEALEFLNRFVPVDGAIATLRLDAFTDTVPVVIENTDLSWVTLVNISGSYTLSADRTGTIAEKEGSLIWVRNAKAPMITAGTNIILKGKVKCAIHVNGGGSLIWDYSNLTIECEPDSDASGNTGETPLYAREASTMNIKNATIILGTTGNKWANGISIATGSTGNFNNSVVTFKGQFTAAGFFANYNAYIQFVGNSTVGGNIKMTNAGVRPGYLFNIYNSFCHVSGLRLTDLPYYANTAENGKIRYHFRSMEGSKIYITNYSLVTTGDDVGQTCITYTENIWDKRGTYYTV